MGWCIFHLNEPAKEWFRKTWENEGKYVVLDSAIVKRKVMYGAIKEKSTGKVFAAVFLVGWYRGWNNFGYKDMTEYSGPCEIECPERIMKLLTPLATENESDVWAANWRKRVYELITKRKALKGIKFFTTKEPITFSNGCSYSNFRKEGHRVYAGRMNASGAFETHFPVRGFNPLRYELV